MTYEDLIKDIEKLVGIELQSIRPGANITILSIDESRGSIIIRNSSGQIKSRPLSEFRTIWDAFSRSKVVHVEGVLHGSGTSRNQPETILSNLPYVEWLKISNKKHIAFVGKNTHPYGTLKKMSSIDGEKLISSMHNNQADSFRLIAVVEDVGETIKQLQQFIQGQAEAINKYEYLFHSANFQLRVINALSTSLEEGMYYISETNENLALPMVNIGNNNYYVLCRNVKILLRLQNNNMGDDIAKL